VDEYSYIYKEPKALPSHKNQDHRIILKQGTPSINVRPYRYPVLEEEIIERTVQEMLQVGVVRLRALILLLCLGKEEKWFLEDVFGL